jgi:RNA polymerase sigma factor, sigma-70 family
MKCDANTFSKMYESLYKDLYRFAFYMMKHAQDAEDAVSEAVISAYENIRKLKNEDAFKSWIFTILANKCKKKLVSSSGKELPLEHYEARTEQDMEISMEIKKAFLILTEEERLIVALSVFAGYTSGEIGNMQKINASTVRSKRKRALEKMSYVLEA